LGGGRLKGKGQSGGTPIDKKRKHPSWRKDLPSVSGGREKALRFSTLGGNIVLLRYHPYRGIGLRVKENRNIQAGPQKWRGRNKEGRHPSLNKTTL